MKISLINTIGVVAFLALLASPNPAMAQAAGTVDGDVTANSLTIHNNATNTITSFLFPDGESWFSNHIWLGNSNYSYATTPEYGPGLFFGGNSSGNTDIVAMYRVNYAPNVTELRMSVGDDVNNTTQCDGNGHCIASPDRFVIGGTDSGNNDVWTPRFTFTTTGMLGIGSSTPAAALDVNGDVHAHDIHGNVFYGTAFFVGVDSPPSSESDASADADTTMASMLAVSNTAKSSAKTTNTVKKLMPLIPTCGPNQYVTANGQAFYCVNLPTR